MTGRGFRARQMAAAIAILLAGGCAQIPSSGPVRDGSAIAQRANLVYLRAVSPRADASPVQLVKGFLDAQTAGPTADFDVAREFLTDVAAEQWNPVSQVIVYDGDLGLVADADTPRGRATVRGVGAVVGVVDEHGVYTEQPPGTTTDLVFDLVREPDNQWRLASPDDGLVISATNFERIYRPTSLYFPSTDRSFLVPDERWFPKRNWQTYAVRETLVGPSAWLAKSVTTVAPEGTVLAIESVTMGDSGPIDIPLNATISQASGEDRTLLAAQLKAVLSDTLTQTVQLYAGNAPLTTGTSPPLRRSITVDDPVVLEGDQVATLTGRTVEPLDRLAPLDGLNPTALAFRSSKDPDSPFVVRSGSSELVTTPVEGVEARTLLTGKDLLAPSLDRFGNVWSGSPTAGLQVVSLEGKARSVTAPWLTERTLDSVRVAPDGARVALLSRDGGRLRIDVAGVVRDGDGVPTELSEPMRVGQTVVTGTQVVWVDQSLLGVLGRVAAEPTVSVQLVPVGGPTRSTTALADASAIAAGPGERSILLNTADESLYTLGAASLWTTVTTGVRAPAYPG